MLSRASGALVSISKYIALIYGLIFMYSFITYPFDPFLQNSLLLQVVIILAFIKLWRKTLKAYLKLTLLMTMIISVVPVAYISLNYTEVAYKAGIPTQVEFIFGLITITSVIGLTWIFIGKILAITTLVFIAYAYLGKFIPGFFGHGGYPLDMLIGYFYMTREGLWSLPLNIASTYVIAFNILGAILAKIKTTKLIMDGLLPLTRRVRGGPAVVAVISNMLLGMVSGSAPENAALTGTAFSSMLRGYGFTPERSAGIIASAAAGALIMPPVMGAAAFLMADLLGVPYRDIVISAFLPAVLFYASLTIHIYLYSSLGLTKGLIKGYELEVVNVGRLLLDYGHILVPLFVVTYYILAGFSPFRAAMYGIIASIVISFIRKSTRINVRTLVDAIYEAMDRIVYLGIAIASASLIYSVVMMSGLGVKLSLVIEYLSAGNLLLTLILIMISCIVLGMGLPATVAYLIVALTIGPALVHLGVHQMAAHMFIFYFSTFSTITPPVALALYTACAVFNSDIMKSGIEAIKLSIPAFIVPYVFIFRPSLLLLSGDSYEVIITFIYTLVGILAIISAIVGYLLRPVSLPMRLVYGLCGVLSLIPNYMLNLVGTSIIIANIIYYIVKK